MGQNDRARPQLGIFQATNPGNLKIPLTSLFVRIPPREGGRASLSEGLPEMLREHGRSCRRRLEQGRTVGLVLVAPPRTLLAGLIVTDSGTLSTLMKRKRKGTGISLFRVAASSGVWEPPARTPRDCSSTSDRGGRTGQARGGPRHPAFRRSSVGSS